MEARAAHLGDARLDHHVVAIARRDQESRPRRDHRKAGEVVGRQQRLLVEPERRLDHELGRVIEHREIAWVKHDPGRVAVAPLDADLAAVGDHACSALVSRMQVPFDPARAPP